MSIPALNENGVLPPGIHGASIEEITEVFGQSIVRCELVDQIRRYIADLQRWPLGKELLIDGSFVTEKQEPNNIDVVLVLRDDYDLSREVSPFEYNLRSNRMAKKKYGLDLFVVQPGSLEYDRFVDLFSQVRNRPDIAKGLVRVQL